MGQFPMGVDMERSKHSVIARGKENLSAQLAAGRSRYDANSAWILPSSARTTLLGAKVPSQVATPCSQMTRRLEFSV